MGIKKINFIFICYKLEGEFDKSCILNLSFKWLYSEFMDRIDWKVKIKIVTYKGILDQPGSCNGLDQDSQNALYS